MRITTGASVILVKLYVSFPVAIKTNPATNKIIPLKSAFFDMLICSMASVKNHLYTQNCKGSKFLKLFMINHHFQANRMVINGRNILGYAIVVEEDCKPGLILFLNQKVL